MERPVRDRASYLVLVRVVRVVRGSRFLHFKIHESHELHKTHENMNGTALQRPRYL